MRHKVTCMDCGDAGRIEVTRGEKVRSGWLYYGKLNIHACQTDKYVYTIPEGFSLLDDKWDRVKNQCYNSSVKPKYVEMWVCPDCAKKLNQTIPQVRGE
jgi:hypothetical protein